MNSLGQSRREVRDAFRDAAEWFASVTSQAQDALDQAALGVWNVRDLVGHTSRAVTTVESYLTPDAQPVTVPTAVEYYLKALRADPEQVAERGRQAGQALGTIPAQAVAETVERVTQLVESQPDDARLNTAAGVMVLTEYLPTRTFELTVVPPSAASSALRLGAELAVAQGPVAPLLLAMTGRMALPAGYSVVQPT